MVGRKEVKSEKFKVKSGCFLTATLKIDSLHKLVISLAVLRNVAPLLRAEDVLFYLSPGAP